MRLHFRIIILAVLSVPFFFLSQAAVAGCGKNAIGTARTLVIGAGGHYGRSHGGRQLPLRAKEIVLTFDDGPLGGKTRSILRILRQHCARATFFPVGKMVQNNRGLVRKIRRAGHTVGSHAMRHINLSKLSYAQGTRQIYNGFAVTARSAGGSVAPFFRPPGFNITPSLKRLLRKNRITVFGTDIDSLDWKGLKGEDMAAHLIKQLKYRRHRGIILFHDINSATVRSLSLVLTLLKKEGYRVVHIRPSRSISMAQIRKIKASPTPLMMSHFQPANTAYNRKRRSKLYRTTKRKRHIRARSRRQHRHRRLSSISYRKKTKYSARIHDRHRTVRKNHYRRAKHRYKTRRKQARLYQARHRRGRI